MGADADPRAPAEFRAEAAGLLTAPQRSDVVVRPAPAPSSVAPFAEAVTLDIGEQASARLVYLYDPSGQEAWQGRERLVGFVRCPVEAEMALDPLMAQVVWSWLAEALTGRGLSLTAEAGTVTTTSNSRFGAIADSGATHEVELRCSWTPDGRVAEHAAAFGDLLALMAGLPPEAPEVVPLPRRPSRG
jgi:hypothetical protein